jgi:5-methyltetrahydropteroyltriglutamate--homocysteine methyltransferase
MKRSETAIRTSHAGRLPPVGAAAGNYASWSPRSSGGPSTEDTSLLVRQVADVIKKQVEIGISCVGDGEFWNGRNFAYYAQQFGGVTTRPLKSGEKGSGREDTRERDIFPKLYADMDRVGTMFCVPGEEPRFSPSTKMVVTGPIKGRATDAIQREVSVFKEALNAVGGADEAFVCVFAPGWLDHHIYNEYYATDEEFVFAIADALREEYRAVTDAGFVLQIDDPGVATSWDMIKPEPSVAEYRKYLKVRIDALNHALAGVPADRVRHHFCWGSWHGAHTHDLPMRDLIDLVLQVNAQCYSFEAGKFIMPGVISHATNLVEHPELIARRLRNFAEAVGRENVVAGSDCGLGSRLHEDLVWAKLSALAQGARLASKALWGK